jgi:hypothetical protein
MMPAKKSAGSLSPTSKESATTPNSTLPKIPEGWEIQLWWRQASGELDNIYSSLRKSDFLEYLDYTINTLKRNKMPVDYDIWVTDGAKLYSGVKREQLEGISPKPKYVKIYNFTTTTTLG